MSRSDFCRSHSQSDPRSPLLQTNLNRSQVWNPSLYFCRFLVAESACWASCYFASLPPSLVLFIFLLCTLPPKSANILVMRTDPIPQTDCIPSPSLKSSSVFSIDLFTARVFSQNEITSAGWELKALTIDSNKGSKHSAGLIYSSLSQKLHPVT